MFDSLIIKYEKVCNSRNIGPIKILQRTKLVKNVILRNFSYVTPSQKSILREIFRIFLFWAPTNPHFLRKIVKIHTYSKSAQYVTTEFHGNRFSHSPVMPAQTDRQKRIPKM